MKTAVAIRHVAFEDVGILHGLLTEAGYGLTYLDAGVDDLAPAMTADLLIVLGGPIGVYEAEAYPFLITEIDILGTQIGRQRPTLGLCLGFQLMAAAWGAGVHTGANGKEIGWKPLTKLGPELAELEGVPVLHWHGDTITAPDWPIIASTDQYENQAFAFGPNILALQFHPEVIGHNFERWLIGHACELSAAGISPVTLRADGRLYAAGLEKAGSALFRRWLAGLDLPAHVPPP